MRGNVAPEQYKQAWAGQASTENRGIEHVLNQGLEIAQGQYIARMDCDDISINRRLKLQVIFMEENPEVGVLGSAFRPFGVNGVRGLKWSGVSGGTTTSTLTYTSASTELGYLRLQWME